MNCNRSLVFLLLLVPALRTPHSALAQEEIAWRKDYATALREAREKNRPLVLDFGTKDCVWCRRLEASTLADPAVARALNERFIPLKIDAEEQPRLAQELRVQSYPTLVLASPAGQILRVQNGYVEVAPFLEILRDALARSAPPAAPAVAAADPPEMRQAYEKAAAAVGRSEFARAVPLLKNVLKEDKKLPVQQKAAKLLADIEKRASTRLGRVKELAAAGKAAEALQADQELVSQFDGTGAAATGKELLSSLNASLEPREDGRRKLARELLAQAREELKTEQYLNCLLRCETITTRFADLPESTDAAELADRIKRDPERMQQVCERVPDLVGALYLSTAEAKLRQGRPQQAVFFLERVMQAFPNTRHAELAQVRLAKIQGPPPLPVSDDKSQ